jgi:integrase
VGNAGSVFKRCGCTEVVDGKRRQLGKHCPKLRRTDGTWNPRHGSWSYTASVPASGGKRKQVMRGGFTNQVEAQTALDELRDKARRGIVVTRRLTVAQYLDEWVAAKADLKPSTVHAYQSHIRLYLTPLLGHHRLDELRSAHVADALADVPVSPATRQRIRATLRSALSDAAREGMVTVNAAGLVKLAPGKRPRGLVWTDDRVKRWREANQALERWQAADLPDPDGTYRAKLEEAAQPPSPVMVWTPAQLGEFLDTAHDDRLYALWHLIAHCGLRRGEAAGLEWTEVDLDNARVQVRRQRTVIGRQVVEGTTKSGAGERVIALDAGTVTVLRAHRKAQLQERMAWGEAWQDTGKMFAKEDGAALHPEYISDRFRTLIAEAGLPPVRLHDLRHGAASLLLAAGVPMKVVSEVLGHSMMSLTADTYSSVFAEVAAEAAEAAAALVPRKGRESQLGRPV